MQKLPLIIVLEYGLNVMWTKWKLKYLEHCQGDNEVEVEEERHKNRDTRKKCCSSGFNWMQCKKAIGFLLSQIFKRCSVFFFIILTIVQLCTNCSICNIWLCLTFCNDFSQSLCCIYRQIDPVIKCTQQRRWWATKTTHSLGWQFMSSDDFYVVARC